MHQWGVLFQLLGKTPTQIPAGVGVFVQVGVGMHVAGWVYVGVGMYVGGWACFCMGGFSMGVSVCACVHDDVAEIIQVCGCIDLGVA